MFDDLHDPHPPQAGIDTLASVSTRARQLRRRRSLLVGGGGVAVVALAIAAVVLPGRDDQRLVSVDEPTTDAPTTLVRDTTEPSPATDPSASDPPTTDSSVADSCRDAPSSPVWLVDGSAPGDVTTETGDDGTMTARWGDNGATTSVTQAPPQPEMDAFEMVAGTDQLVSAGEFRAAVVPVGGERFGQITIAFDTGDCERWYWVGPGVELDSAIAFAQDWVDALQIDSSMEITTSAVDACVTIGSEGFEHCTEIGQDSAAVMGAMSSDLVPGTSLWLFTAVMPAGSVIEAPSSLARVTPVPGTSDVHLVDLMRDGACGTLRAADGSVTPIGDGCGPGPSNPSSERPIVAIDGNGDAVVFDSDFRIKLVYGGTDPDDPPPLEGEVAYLDGVAVTDDGTTAIVGICCEPVPGSLVSVDLATGVEDYVGFGRLPSTTRFGNMVWATLGSDGATDLVPAVVVGDIDGSVSTTLQTFPLDSVIVDLAVVPEPSGLGDAVLVLLATPDGVEFWRLLVGGGDMFMSATISDVAWTEDAGLSLAGYSAGSFFVLDDANDRLLEFDGLTLNAVAVPVVAFPSISAWITPDSRRAVSSDRRLTVDGVELPGEYLWVR